MTLPPPKNSTALALYLLINQPLYGVSQYEAVISDRFFKFNTRVSDLVLKHKISIQKKREDGKNRFNHPYQNTRYCLYQSDIAKNIKLYNEINN